ncbi:hypothetical protein ACFSVN_00400 [Gracilimonas halophila]|uniref:Uncharacterized protein n=1 Tax=Gracilimonas halophila TaxID=1834464 RepID=A0ABW5JFW7_9BACT
MATMFIKAAETNPPKGHLIEIKTGAATSVRIIVAAQNTFNDLAK